MDNEQFEFDALHHGHHQHAQQHSQNQNVFGQPPHGPGFWSGVPPPPGGFGGNPGLGPAGGMDFSMFMYNGNGNMSGSERVKKV